jgi:hypothetical protein
MEDSYIRVQGKMRYDDLLEIIQPSAGKFNDIFFSKCFESLVNLRKK